MDQGNQPHPRRATPAAAMCDTRSRRIDTAGSAVVIGRPLARGRGANPRRGLRAARRRSV